MQVDIQSIDLQYPNGRLIRIAARVLQEKGVIVYPTDTIYGLGADILEKNALDRILRIKKVSRHKLMSFIFADMKGIADWAYIPDYAFRIMRRATPGPYTFILKASKLVPKMLLQNRPTIGVRIPDAPIPRGIVEQLGRPLLNTSVPLGDDGFYSDPLEIARKYPHEIDLILDAGMIANVPSTVVDCSGHRPEIIRAGAGDVSMILGDSR